MMMIDGYLDIMSRYVCLLIIKKGIRLSSRERKNSTTEYNLSGGKEKKDTLYKIFPIIKIIFIYLYNIIVNKYIYLEKTQSK